MTPFIVTFVKLQPSPSDTLLATLNLMKWLESIHIVHRKFTCWEKYYFQPLHIHKHQLLKSETMNSNGLDIIVFLQIIPGTVAKASSMSL